MALVILGQISGESCHPTRMMRRRGRRGKVPAMSRHLMEPDPEAPLPSLGYLLWLCAFVLGVFVTALQLAT